MSFGRSRRCRLVVVGDRAPGCSVEIIILAALQRPEEADETGKSKRKGQRDQDDHHFHDEVSSATRRARSAFSITRIDDPDIAAAAISGVTTPLMASGTARKL